MYAIRGRQQERQRMSLSKFLCLLVLFFTFVYMYFYHNGAMNGNNRPAGERCVSELSSLKYQLESVSDYRKKMDIIMAQLEQECKTQKNQEKELANSYRLVKAHLDICEMQSEELEIECTELKAQLMKANKQLETCKKPAG